MTNAGFTIFPPSGLTRYKVVVLLPALAAKVKLYVNLPIAPEAEPPAVVLIELTVEPKVTFQNLALFVCEAKLTSVNPSPSGNLKLLASFPAPSQLSKSIVSGSYKANFAPLLVFIVG